MHPSRLEIGSYYYRLTFVDPKLWVPGLKPVIYVGENILEDDVDEKEVTYYFQDSVSFSRFGLAPEVGRENSAECLIISESPDSLPKSIVTLDEAVMLFKNILEGKGPFAE
jgi:hypothetical protein